VNHASSRLHPRFPGRRAAVALVVALAGAVPAGPAGAAQWIAAGAPSAVATGSPASAARITFVVREMGVPVEGSFRRFESRFTIDPAKPEAARAQVEIELASIDTGNEEANAEVIGRSWFDARNHPRARFTSTGVKALGPNRFEVRGTLEIKGREQSIVLPVSLATQGGQAAFDGSFTIRRADFVIGEGSWSDFDTVANEIQVRFHFPAVAGK
jgi:polyisoprenoid-binding protein YceI